MAVTETDLALMAQSVSGSTKNQWWALRTSDAVGTVQGAGYFATLGSTSGNSLLLDGDMIVAVCNGALYILEVTDAAAGTAGNKLSPA